ncbi:hypothetical protein AB0J38_14550 [Streptomyces sp. NPDC050095]|uniref:hypothetical protein n=1 Tax=unclassified Streptomyces TaxID=2593676 RepID=UPI0034394442
MSTFISPQHNAASAVMRRDDQTLTILVMNGKLTRTNSDRDAGNIGTPNAQSTIDITAEASTTADQISYQKEAVRFAVQQGWTLISNQGFFA